MPGLKLNNKKKLSTHKNLNPFDKIEYVYIPLISFNDENLTELVKKDDYVYKGEVLAKRKGDQKMPIYSSVSGTVIDFEEHTYLNGNKVKCIKIKNDFKDKIKEEYLKKEINTYSKEEFINLLKNNNIVGLGGAGFPTYLKYETDTKINTLLVNAVECEPYLSCDFMLAKKRCEEILETIDAIQEINNIEKAIIVFKDDNKELINLYTSYAGTYLKIKIATVPSKYPSGWERNIVKHVCHLDYDKYPIEKGIVVNNIGTIYAIYETLKYNHPITERVVTFSGETLNYPQNIIVKIGTKISDLVEYIGGVKSEDYIIIANGPMMGKEVDNDLVVSPTLSAVLFLKQEKDIMTSCLRCGKCSLVCPAKLSPVMIMDNIKNKDRLKKLEPNKCINCGLCSYICPAKIDVRDKVNEARRNI